MTIKIAGNKYICSAFGSPEKKHNDTPYAITKVIINKHAEFLRIVINTNDNDNINNPIPIIPLSRSKLTY